MVMDIRLCRGVRGVQSEKDLLSEQMDKGQNEHARKLRDENER